FQCSESVEEKGKKSKIKHDLTLLNPINVIQVRNRNTQGEVSQKVSSNFILVVRILLKITNENNYEGFLSVSDTIDLIKNLHNVLSQFFIKNEEDQKKEQELSKEDNILREDKEEHIIKCSKCSWLLSAGAIICPRCNTSVTEVEDKSFFNVDQSGYDKTSALHGEKEKSFTKKLMSDFDKALANWGDAEDKYQTIVKNNFTDMLMDENLKN
ncbi:MAG: hypothetical protein GY870_19940, partial [archaeon]|nr:hypothetical protein [archaeon]